jgi:hypothetical protein
MKLTRFLLVILFLCSPSFSLTKSPILREKKIRIAPLLETGGKLYVQQNKVSNPSLPVTLLLADGSHQEVTLVTKEPLPKIDWGSSDTDKSYAIEAKSGALGKGMWIAIGADAPKTIVWHFAKQTFQEGSRVNETSLQNSKFQIPKFHLFQLRRFAIDKFGDEFYLAFYRKKKLGECDRDTYREDFIAGKTLTNITDCDGMKGKHDIGPLLGAFEIKEGNQNEIWLVLQAHGYESYGYTFIQFNEKKKTLDSKKMDYMGTGGF